MSSFKWIAAALGVALLGVSHTLAEDQPVKPVAQWTGSVDYEHLENIAPQAITSHESLGILWKAWQADGEVPDVDFDASFVIASTTRGSKLNVSFQLDKDGNLQILEMGTRDLRPGFRYVLTQISQEGVLTVNRQPLPGHLLGVAPAIVPTGIPYQPAQAVTGTVRLGGSRTMSHLIQLWAQSFQQFHPDVKFEILNRGSETAVAELKKEGLAIMGVSHMASPAEVKTWEKELGKRLQMFPVCTDDIAVIVHPDNPISQLSPDQLKKVFVPGASESLTWGQLGLKGEWADKPVTAHGRDRSSGTRSYLLSLAGGDNSGDDPAQEHDSYSQIVEAVAADPHAIGYCRAENVRNSVKSVSVGPLAGGEARPFLTRTCQLVVALPEGEEMPSPIKEFLLHAYRLDGQALLFRDGFSPLGKDTLGEQLQRLGVIDEK